MCRLSISTAQQLKARAEGRPEPEALPEDEVQMLTEQMGELAAREAALREFMLMRLESFVCRWCCDISPGSVPC
jgi:hypothetical protein